MLKQLVRPAKDLLRGPYRKLHKKYQLTFRGFTSADLLRSLRELGISHGDNIFVHSGMTEFAGFHGRIPDIVRTFQEAVGAGGSLLMPTFPFTGSAVDYARRRVVFDPRINPSKVGLLTEIFRRFPDVRRSVHPTHPVAVWSRQPDWWTENHLLADSPCGRGTPFDRLWESDGKIVFAGVTIGCITYFHYAEEILEPLMPFSPFTRERFSMPCRVNGVAVESHAMRLYDPAVSRRRRIALLAEELQRTGRWRAERVGTLNLVVLRAREVSQTLQEMAERGLFCYAPEDNLSSPAHTADPP